MLQVTEYEIFSGKLPKEFDGFKIVQLSDLHGKVFGIRNTRLLKVVEGQKPDLVVMTGDMADNSRFAVARAVHVCSALAKKFPVYFVAGNHELALKGRRLPQFILRIRKEGVRILANTGGRIRRGSACIRVYGLHMPLVYYKDPATKDYKFWIRFREADMRRALGCCDREHFSLLLAHNPLYFPAYRDWGADLTLSGHMHGGVIRIPGIGGLISPDMTLFPHYDAGHFEEKGRQLIISRGLGNHILWRVFNPPEVVSITLRSGGCMHSALGFRSPQG